MTIDRRDLLISAGGAVAAMALTTRVMAQAASSEAEAAAPVGGEMAPYEALNNEQRVNVINLRHIEEDARKILPPESYAYISSGSGDEWTLRENEAAFNRWVIDPDYLSGVKTPDLSTTLLGEKLSLPVFTAPMGGQGRAHALKEIPGVQGTGAAGTLYVTTTVSHTSLEDVAEAATGPKWFQIYFPENRDFAREQLERAKAAGYTAIVITVDSTTFSNRERPTFLGVPSPNFPNGNVPQNPDIDPVMARVQKADLNWDDVAFCQEVTGLPVLVKGVLTPKLASECITRGCAGIWVSNHGGRGMDKLAPAISTLPRIADAVGGKVPIIIDSGFRRGQDVFQALALGADAVALGRPILYGMALGGSQGVQAVFQRIRTELQMVMQLAGVQDIDGITKDYLTLLSDL